MSTFILFMRIYCQFIFLEQFYARLNFQLSVVLESEIKFFRDSIYSWLYFFAVHTAIILDTGCVCLPFTASPPPPCRSFTPRPSFHLYCDPGFNMYDPPMCTHCKKKNNAWGWAKDNKAFPMSNNLGILISRYTSVAKQLHPPPASKSGKRQLFIGPRRGTFSFRTARLSSLANHQSTSPSKTIRYENKQVHDVVKTAQGNRLFF